MKKLPVINHVTFDVVLPSTEKKLTLRPFTVQEEKILLTASSSSDPSYIAKTMKQIILNCVVSGDIDTNALAIFDVEYLFINLRSKSVGSSVPLEIEEEGVKYKGVLDLDKLIVERNPEHTSKIMVSDDIGVLLSYPTLEASSKIDTEKDESVFDLIMSCVQKIFNGDDVFVRSDDFDEKGLEEFVMSLPSQSFKKITRFFETMPRVKADVTFKSADGIEIVRELRGLQSFFQ